MLNLKGFTMMQHASEHVVTVFSGVILLHHLIYLRTEYINNSFSKDPQLHGFTLTTRECVCVYTQAYTEAYSFFSDISEDKTRVPVIFDYMATVISQLLAVWHPSGAVLQHLRSLSEQKLLA